MDNNAQNPEQNTTSPKLQPDFSHRLGLFDGEATALNLRDAVNTLALQADNVLIMLSGNFCGEDEDVQKYNDNVIFWTLESVRAMVNDINAIVEAYHLANRPKTEANQNKRRA